MRIGAVRTGAALRSILGHARTKAPKAECNRVDGFVQVRRASGQPDAFANGRALTCRLSVFVLSVRLARKSVTFRCSREQDEPSVCRTDAYEREVQNIWSNNQSACCTHRQRSFFLKPTDP
ncbi:hypothetical protein EVAR_34477_1 [Eumeta japonica]|uniref:Uncharacterized protein n=1 Tax=Eumeta variegata TaxID=151549 RepID=A0A4C1WWI2_EUMVA|nr:hypothetical protein EVAR_34477_1 [Eumeta japonica]